MQFEAISKHMLNERMDRYIFIQTHSGIGEPILEVFNKRTQHLEVLTDTGVLIITDKNKKVLITCYYTTIDKVMAMYRSSGEKSIPKAVKTTLERNKAKNYLTLQNK